MGKCVFVSNKQLGWRAFCADSRCAYVGDAGALIRLLRGLSSHLHVLMEVESVCLRWPTPTLPLCPVAALLAKNKREALEQHCCSRLSIPHSAVIFHYILLTML